MRKERGSGRVLFLTLRREVSIIVPYVEKRGGRGLNREIRRIVRDNLRALQQSAHTMQGVYGVMFRPMQNTMLESCADGRIVCLSYGEVRERIEHCAAAIYGAVGATGEYIALEMENSAEWIVAFWALLRSGNRPYLVNTRHPQTLTQKILCTLGVRYVLARGKTALSAELLDFDRLEGGTEVPESVFADEFALATSATSLHETICVYTGREVAAQLLNSPEILRKCPQMARHYHGALKQLAFLPFYHVFGLFAVYFWFTFFGRTLVLLPDYAPDTILKTCRRHEVTHLFAVPMLWHQIEAQLMRTLEKEGKRGRFDRALRLCTAVQNLWPYAGEAFSRRVLHEATDRLFGRSVRFCISGGSALRTEALVLLNGLGYNLHNGYGMSETGITSVELRARPKYKNRNSIGRPFDSVRCRLSPRGTIEISGRSLCCRRITDGRVLQRGEWLDSGDVAECVAGDWYLRGRLGDMVLGENGENINPDEVERFFTLPDAEAFCVLGLPSSAGERLTLVMQLSPYLSASRVEALMQAAYAANEALPGAGRVRDFRVTYDPIAAPTAIKVSRAALLRAIEQGRVHLREFSELRAQTQTGVHPELYARVCAVIARTLHVDEEKIQLQTHVVYDLGADSLSYLELLGQMDAEFSLPSTSDGQTNCYTVAEFCDYVERNIL